jgi:hypothetical protein
MDSLAHYSLSSGPTAAQSPFSASHGLVSGKPGATLALSVERAGGRMHLPIAKLDHVA